MKKQKTTSEKSILPFYSLKEDRENTRRIIGARIYYLNGKEDKIEVNMPKITNNGDDFLLGWKALETFILEMCAHHLKIEKYELYMYLTDLMGEQICTTIWQSAEYIPLNKVYDFEKGWVELPQHNPNF